MAAVPSFPAPSPAFLLEEIAAGVGTTGARLIARRGSPAKAHAAWLMAEHGYEPRDIAAALGYGRPSCAVRAVARWERMRKGRVS